MVDQGCSGGSAASGEVYDVIGIGFGPANLALAVAMEEAPPEDQLKRLFLEAKASYVWHPGMLLEDSLLQITVLKDLVMVENPRSRFTFLNYLKEKGRLYEFLNLRDLFPTRIEFNDYLGWAAAQLEHRVLYGREVLRVLPAGGVAERVRPELLRIVARDRATGAEVEYLARHLVLAAGAEPVLPPGVELDASGRIMHPHCFMQRISSFPDREAPYRFVVVGSGQSGAEIFEYLMDQYPNADVTAAIRRFSYKPVDESDFTNRIFFPEWVDYYHALPDAQRRSLFESLKDVNYGVIDHPLIHRIYQKLYRQKAAGSERCRLLPFLDFQRIREQPDGLEVEFRDLMQQRQVVLEADGVVLCTGYVWRKEHPVLDDLGPYFERDSLDGYRVQRDYSIAARPEFQPKVYLQGYCEDTHGICETVLSLLPVRAKDILTSILEARRTPRDVMPVEV